MIWPKLGANLLLGAAIVAAVAIVFTWQNLARRETIDAQFPAIGQFITVNGARVHYKTSGFGPDLVLIHGASGNLREWEFGLRTALEGRYRVSAFDRPGHGHSDAIKGGTHLNAQAAHLRAAAQALGITAPVLVGHSYGGSVALAWSLIEKPAALMLIAAPSLPWLGGLDITYRLTSGLLGRWIVAPLAAALVPQAYVNRATIAVFAPQQPPIGYLQDFGAMLATRAGSLATNSAQVSALLGDIASQMAGYSALDMPTGLIHGDQDTIVPLDIHAQKLAQILPKAQLTVVQGAGHMPHHAHRSAVLMALERLLP